MEEEEKKLEKGREKKETVGEKEEKNELSQEARANKDLLLRFFNR